jgi:hypothetical protein
VSVAVYEPGSAYACVVDGPPDALGEPSPNSQTYVSVAWSSAPGSWPAPLNATGRPHAAVVFGPATARGATFATVTENVWDEVRPVASVAVSRPE